MHIVGQAFSTFSLWNWANTISDTYCTFSYLTDVLFDNLPVKIWEKRILVLYSRKYPLCPVGHAQLQQSLITLKYVHTWYTNLEDSLRILHSQSFRLRVDYTYVKYKSIFVYEVIIYSYSFISSSISVSVIGEEMSSQICRKLSIVI